MLKCLIATMLVASTLTVSQAARSADLPSYPFIHASGNGFLMMLPDRGEIDFEISAYDADPAMSLALVNERAAELRALVEQLGMDTAQLEIRDVRREMRKSEGAEAKEPLYDLVCSVHIDVRDVSKWRALIAPILAMKNLDHFSTSFSASERDKIEGELMLQALKDARRRADTMARGVGKTVVGATAVSAGQLKNLTGAIGLQTTNMDSNSDRAARNTQEVRDLTMLVTLRMSQSVDVIYKIK
jgi:uncharacterized protein YggE